MNSLMSDTISLGDIEFLILNEAKPTLQSSSFYNEYSYQVSKIKWKKYSWLVKFRQII